MDYRDLQRALRHRAGERTTHAGVFIETSQRLTARFSDSAIVDLAFARHQGANARWLSPERAEHRAFSTVDPALLARLVRQPPGNAPDDGPTETGRPSADGDGRGGAGEAAEYLTRLLAGIDAAARDHDTRIRQVLIDAEYVTQHVTYAGLEKVTRDQRHLRYLTIKVVAAQGDRVVSGFFTPGTSDPGEELDAVALGRQAAGRAVASLSARPAPIAHMPVVVGSGRGMVMVHEACCHPLEADEIIRGSIYGREIGSEIAAPGVTITDSPLLPGAVGSYRHDDEGVPAQSTVIVDDGRLAGFLTDRHTAARLGHAETGNGRRAGYGDMPLPRMSNTCVTGGDLAPEEIIASTKFGLYAQHVGGGEVSEATGDFVFRVLNGYLISEGKITDPVRETTVRGRGPDVLRGIDAIGNDVRTGAARCGKFGQRIPVGVSGPTLRIGSLLVGGTQ
jgi:TldD protein